MRLADPAPMSVRTDHVSTRRTLRDVDGSGVSPQAQHRRLTSWVVIGAAAIMVALASLGLSGDDAAAQDDQRGPVYIVQITGTIDLGLAPYLDRVLGEAEDADAEAVIVEIDTPGGRLDAVLQMRDALSDTPLRTIAIVDSTAFSAGALVAISCEEIYMTPGAVMGAATPVVGGTGEVADEKTISAVRATFEATAEENGRDPEVAAAMVDTSVEIDGLVDDDQLLTLTVEEALDVGYAEGVVPDVSGLLDEVGLADRELVEPGLSLAEQLVRFITNPVLAGLLLLAGFLLLVGDLFSGGIGIVAAVGAALLGLFFWGHNLAGLTGWEDVALVALGVALIAVEVFVIPGFGVAGVLGLISVGAGAFLAMTFRDFDFVTTDDMWRAGLTVALALIGATIGMIAILSMLARSGSSRGLVLQARLGSGESLPTRSSSGWLRWFGAEDRLEHDRPERTDSTTVPQPATASDTPPSGDSPEGGTRSLTGVTGVALTDLRPSGLVDIDGERVDAITSGELVRRGEPIEVVRDEHYRRVVRRRASD